MRGTYHPGEVPAASPSLIERAFDWYLDKMHMTGERAWNQLQFYRCVACRSIVTWKRIRQEGGCKCGSARISPTMPLFGEKLRLIFLPWTV